MPNPRTIPRRTFHKLTAAAAGAAFLPACSPRQYPPEPLRAPRDCNILCIVVDTLRADHLGAYGYGRPVSPFMDSLAASGLVFEDASSNSSYTRESVASILSGRIPSRSGAFGWNTRLPAVNPNLANPASATGRFSSFSTNHPNLSTPPYTNWLGFEHTANAQRSFSSGRGMSLTRGVLNTIERNREQPFIAYVQYLDPHAPYQPPWDCRARLGDEPLRDALPFLHIRQNLPALLAEGFGPGDAQFVDMVKRYDAEILHTDDCIRALIEGIDRLGLSDNTLVVVTADHGEEFLEHGFVDHAWTVYQEVLRVPLIFHWPRCIAPGRVDTPVSLVDLLPTFHAVADEAVEPGTFDGSTLLAWNDEQLEPVALSRPMTAQVLIQERCLVHAVREGNLSYITWQRFEPPSERPRASDERLERTRALSSGELQRLELDAPPVREELYDLARDPFQQEDVAPEQPEALARMRARWREQLAVGGEAPEEVPVEVDPADREALEALGYA